MFPSSVSYSSPESTIRVVKVKLSLVMIVLPNPQTEKPCVRMHLCTQNTNSVRLSSLSSSYNIWADLKAYYVIITPQCAFSSSYPVSRCQQQSNYVGLPLPNHCQEERTQQSIAILRNRHVKCHIQSQPVCFKQTNWLLCPRSSPSRSRFGET